MSARLRLPDNRRAFTLIEMIISITIFAAIAIMAFDVLGNIGVVRSKISDQFDMNNELYGAVEQLSSIIKEWWEIDYEEYWNRRSVGTATTSGHYRDFSGYGNYGSGGVFGSTTYGDYFYYCRSGSGAAMGTWGCLTGFNSLLDKSLPDRNYSGRPQRYGQYKFQFIDYNSYGSWGESTEDLGDDDSDGNIRWDDDDEDLGIGPEAFSGWIGLQELYLMRYTPTPERLYLRWNLRPDPYGPTPTSCSMSGTEAGSGCLGNIQILRLVGRDLGISHSGAVSSTGRYDGAIDTWECRSDFNCLGANNLPSGADAEWVDLFPSYVNVRSVNFFPYPNRHPVYSWADDDTSIVVNPYVRLNITLSLAWERKKKLKTPTKDLSVSTTINLAR